MEQHSQFRKAADSAKRLFRVEGAYGFDVTADGKKFLLGRDIRNVALDDGANPLTSSCTLLRALVICVDA